MSQINIIGLYIYIYIYIYIYERSKMAKDTEQRIDCALEDILNATNQSKDVKSELKKTILESVITLRNLFHALKKDSG